MTRAQRPDRCDRLPHRRRFGVVWIEHHRIALVGDAEEGPLLVGHYTCTEGAGKVTWDKN